MVLKDFIFSAKICGFIVDICLSIKKMNSFRKSISGFICVCLILIFKPSIAQVSIRDSSVSLFAISFNYTFNLPAADMAIRFGYSSQISSGFMYKFKSNFFIAPHFAFFFSAKVNDSFVLDHIKTSDGYLINNQGTLCPISIEQRGFHSGIQLGYLINFKRPNPNSGIVISAGPVFLQHKLYFDYSNGPVFQIEGAYKKGYDRLTNGIGLIQTIGFQRFGNRGMGNYHFLIYVLEGFTSSRRDFDFYLQHKDDAKRIDMLIGIQTGFDIPILRKSNLDFRFK